MGTISIGPGLSGFPAFPELAFEDPAQLPALFAALGFSFTDEAFSFTLKNAVFGVAQPFAFAFTFEGDFSSLAALSPEELPAAFDPARAGEFSVSFRATTVPETVSDRLVIGIEADAPSPPLPFAFFFGTLLDPDNFTTDILTALFGNLESFDVLDLTAFGNGVVMGRPNGATIGVDGVINAPDGFAAAAVGVISFASEIEALAFTTVLGGGGDDVIATQALDTAIDGGAGDDVLLGRSGADTVVGGTGEDVLIGGSGPDRIEGGAGADRLVLGAGSDTGLGGSGDDTIVLGAGGDAAAGGAGADLFLVERAAGTVTTIADFSAAEGDRLDLSALFGKGLFGPFARARIEARAQDEDLSLEVDLGGGRLQTVVLADLERPAAVAAAIAVPDLLDALRPAPGAIDLGGGVLLDDGRGGLAVPAREGGTYLGRAGNDAFFGRAGEDRPFGGEGADVLAGRGGEDILFGQEGADLLLGGRGDDILDGGDGSDRLAGGAGFDVLAGGAGADTFVLSAAADGIDRITDFEVGVDVIGLSADLPTVTEATFDDFVRITPLGPTELTGFVSLDRDGAGTRRDFEVVAQLDGEPFALGDGGSAPVIGSTTSSSESPNRRRGCRTRRTGSAACH